MPTAARMMVSQASPSELKAACMTGVSSARMRSPRIGPATAPRSHDAKDGRHDEPRHEQGERLLRQEGQEDSFHLLTRVRVPDDGGAPGSSGPRTPDERAHRPD